MNNSDSVNEKNNTSLSQAYRNYFDIGTAVNVNVLASHGETVRTQFGSLTCENEMKFSSVHPAPEQYTFDRADAIADFASANGMKMRGHTLVWHSQVCQWLFKDENGGETDRDTLYLRMKEHISTVVKRYSGKVYCWDVVNEAVSDRDGEYLREDSPYYSISKSGEYIEKAFEFAHQADPSALLFYNDYNTENPQKRERVYRLVKSLKDKGVPIHGIGLQAHLDIYFDPGELRKSIDLFSSLGLTVHITELDVSIYSYSERELRFETPPPDRMERQEQVYSGIFAVLRENKDKVGSVTFWGLNDAVSWLNSYPVRRKNFPLLLDREGKPKGVYSKIVNFSGRDQQI